MAANRTAETSSLPLWAACTSSMARGSLEALVSTALAVSPRASPTAGSCNGKRAASQLRNVVSSGASPTGSTRANRTISRRSSPLGRGPTTTRVSGRRDPTRSRARAAPSTALSRRRRAWFPMLSTTKTRSSDLSPATKASATLMVTPAICKGFVSRRNAAPCRISATASTGVVAIRGRAPIGSARSGR